MHRTPFLLLLLFLFFASGPDLRAGQAQPQLTRPQLEQVWAEFTSTPTDCAKAETKVLFKKLEDIGPSMPVIDKLRQMKKAYGDTPEYKNFASVETGIMKTVFTAVKDARTKAWTSLSESPHLMKQYYAMGDIGSWLKETSCDFSKDVDITAFAVKDPQGKAPEAFDQTFAKFFADDIGTHPINCDVVVTTSGNEAKAGVFVTQGGNKFAVSGMELVRISVEGGKVNFTPATLEQLVTYKLIADMRNDARMKDFFDPKDPNPQKMKSLSPEEADTMTKMLEKFYPDALNYFFMSVDSAPAIGDFKLQLWSHVLQSDQLSQHTRIKQAAKYASRGSLALQDGMAELQKMGINVAASLSPEQKAVADLARTLDELRDNDTVAYQKCIEDNFGYPPVADKVDRFVHAADELLKTQMDLTHKGAILDTLSMKDGDLNNKRMRALENMLSQYNKIQDQAKSLDYDDMAKKNGLYIDEVTKLIRLEQGGSLKGIQMVYEQQQNILKTPAAEREAVLKFLGESDGGKVLAKPMKVFLDGDGAYLAYHKSTLPGDTFNAIKTLIAIPVESLQQEVQEKGAMMVTLDYLSLAAACLQKYTDAVNTDASTFMAFAEVIGMEVISRKIPYFSLIYGGWNAAMAGDYKQLAKMFFYTLGPPGMIPELIKGLGDVALSVGQTWIFDDQLEALYEAAVFDPPDGEEPKEWSGRVSDTAEVIRYTYKQFKSTKFTYEGVDGLFEFYSNVLHDMDVGSAYKAGGNEMQTGVTLLKNMAVKPVLLAMTVEGKHSLFNRDPGLKQYIAALSQLDGELAQFEKVPFQPGITGTLEKQGTDIVLSTTRDSVEDWGNLKPVPAGPKTGLPLVIEEIVKKRAATRDLLLRRLAEATVETFEARKRAKFLVRNNILKQTVYEQLAEAAKVLHVENELLPAIEDIITEQLKELGEEDTGKIQFIVNKWVATYNQLAGLRGELIQMGIALGVNKGYLEGPNGPLARIPPLKLDPDTDLKTGQRAMKDFGAIPEGVTIILNRAAGGDAQKLGLYEEQAKALARIRFEAMVQEFWFRGPEGSEPFLWTDFEKPVTDEAFKARVEATLESSWKKWLQEYWQNIAQANAAIRKIQLLEYARDYNRIRNEIWAERQFAITTAPADFALAPGETGNLGLIAAHAKPSIKWRIHRQTDGLKVAGGQSGSFVQGGDAAQLLQIRADENSAPGVYNIELILLLVVDNAPFSMVDTAEKTVETRIIQIPVTVGGPVQGDEGSAKTPTDEKMTGGDVKQDEGKVKLSVLDKASGDPLDEVDISIVHPGGESTRIQTVSGAAEATLPAGHYLFTLNKAGYKERIERRNSAGSGELRFELSSTTPLVTGAPRKFLKFAIHPTEIIMRSGDQRSISATALIMKGPVVIPQDVSTEAVWTTKNPELIAVGAGIIKSLGGTGTAEVEVTYSPDPQSAPLRATCRVRIEKKAPDLPQIAIEVSPDQPTYKPGSVLTFTMVTSDPDGPWEYSWHMGGGDKTGRKATYTFMDAGKYTVRAMVRSKIDGREDVVTKTVEIGQAAPAFEDAEISLSPSPPYSAPASIEIQLKGAEGEWVEWKVNGERVEKTQGKWSYLFTRTGENTIRAELADAGGKVFSKTITVGEKSKSGPMASQVNRFDKGEDGGITRVRSSYWKEKNTGYGDWTEYVVFDTVGACKNALVTTGPQADGYNAGWLICVPSDRNQIMAKAYGFNYGAMTGRTSYEGSFDLHGKTVDPKSLKITETTPYSITVEWGASDGSLGRVGVHKYPADTTSFTQAGIREIAFTEPREPVQEDTAPEFENIAPGVFVQIDKKTHLAQVRVEPPCEYVLVTVRPRGASEKIPGFIGREGLFRAEKSYKHHRDWEMRLAPGTYQLPYPSKAEAEQYGVYAVRLEIRDKESRLLRPYVTLADKSEVALPLTSMTGGSTTLTRPVISEVIFQSRRWPIRLQEGVLEIQGERQGQYPWHQNWIQLGTGVENFNTFGTSEGPLVVFQTKDRWHAVILNYASGRREKEYSSNKEIEIRRGGTYGAVLSIEGRCYEFTPNKQGMAEVDCDSQKYIGPGIR